MNRYWELGQFARLSQAALEMRVFTVSELRSLTGVCPNTIYSFLTQMDENYLQSENLEKTTDAPMRAGRPRKRYWLTEAGAVRLARENSELLVSMAKMREGLPPTLEQLREQILRLSAQDQAVLLDLLRTLEEDRQALVKVLQRSLPATAEVESAAEETSAAEEKRTVAATHELAGS
jgi:DNA-binding PadR family transcriptional regulator